MLKVLMIEDNPDIVESVSLVLRLRWPEAHLTGAAEGGQGLTMARSQSPDLIILDLGLPDMDGFKVLEDIRNFTDKPIIILTARAGEMDKLKGLETGADDYITKPFSHTELLARMRAVLRRAERFKFEGGVKPFITQYLTIDFANRVITRESQPVKLTPTEYNLLTYLVMNEGTVLTHRALLEKVWGEQYFDATDYLKVYVQRLRNKLERDPSSPEMFLTERGIGYKFIRPS
ncbi:MAG: response regulator transcription factor [Chloroflexota bacterium]